MIKQLYAIFFILSCLFCNAALSNQDYKQLKEDREKELLAFKIRVKTLLDSGADFRNIGNKSPLLDEKILEFPDLLKKLIEKGADVDIKGHLRQTPLHRAIIHRKLKCVSILLEGGADPNYNPNHFVANAAPLEEAISRGCLEIVKELLKFGADVRTISSNGNTLIMEAFLGDTIFLNLQEKRTAIAEELINAGADPMQVNRKGLTSLKFAQEEFFSLSLNPLKSKDFVNKYKEDLQYLFNLIQKLNNKANDDLAKESCTICYEEFISTHLINPCDTCKLQYCVPCIKNWSQKNPTCPTCKKLIIVKADVPPAIRELDDWLFEQEVD
jgi:ankyrin repeat protein